METLKQFKTRRTLAAMEKYGASLLVASSAESIYYLSGYFPVVLTFSNLAQAYCVYDPASGKTAFVCSASDTANVVEAGVFDRVFTFGEFFFQITDESDFAQAATAWLENRSPDPAAALVAACSWLCPGKARIALEECRIPPATWKALETALPGVTLLPGGQILQQIRCIKHKDEQALLAASAKMAEAAYMDAVNAIRPGVSEADLCNAYDRSLLSRGASPYFCVITMDERSAYVDTLPDPHQYAHNGSFLRFDFGCVYQYYRSDIARMAVLGKNEKAEEYYKWIRAGVEAGMAAAKPGVTAGEIFDVMTGAVREGIPSYQRNHTGHGIGVTMYDIPSIAPRSDFQLEEDMVLCLETPYYEIGWGGIMLEETILIQAGGAHCLTSGAHELTYIKC